jgi:hypothetical protein
MVLQKPSEAGVRKDSFSIQVAGGRSEVGPAENQIHLFL